MTSPVNQPQIKTVEDIYNSPFQILTHKEYWKNELIYGLGNTSKHHNWSDKIIAIDDIEEIYEGINMYNTSVLFLVHSDSPTILIRVQKLLNIRGYYNTHIQITKQIIAYHLHDKFLFFDRFNDITHQMQSAGLIDIWMRWVQYRVENDLLKMNLERLKLLPENDVQVIHFPMFIVYGWVAGGIMLVIEIVWKKFIHFWSTRINILKLRWIYCRLNKNIFKK